MEKKKDEETNVIFEKWPKRIVLRKVVKTKENKAVTVCSK